MIFGVEFKQDHITNIGGEVGRGKRVCPISAYNHFYRGLIKTRSEPIYAYDS